MTDHFSSPYVQDLEVWARQRLDTLLARTTGTPKPLTKADTAKGWHDLAQEASYADDQKRARHAVESGLASPGGKTPQMRLAFYRMLSTLDSTDESGYDAEYSSEALQRRIQLLHDLGQHHQADMEQQLGEILYREPEPFESTVLTGVVESERSSSSLDNVMVDALVSLAVGKVENHEPSEAATLLDEAWEVLKKRQQADFVIAEGQETSLKMFMAHTSLMGGNLQAADLAAEELILRGCNRAVRAAMNMVRGVVAYQDSENESSLEFALKSAELYTALDVRAGASSAAALAATVANELNLPDVAVKAWTVALRHAEQGKISEAPNLMLALGHQLLETGDYAGSEKVLSDLMKRDDFTQNEGALPRLLVDLGHAVRHQERADEALEHWGHAVQLFEQSGSVEEAVRVLLAMGAMLSREHREDESLERLKRAVQLARSVQGANPAVLSQALHALGHVLAERGERKGVQLLDEAIDLAKSSSAGWHQADFTDTRARALWSLEEGPAAVSTALNASDLYSASDDPGSARQSELFAAHVLLERELTSEATTMFSLISTDSTASPSIQMAAYIGLAKTYELTGDEDQAAQAMRQADEIAEFLTSGTSGA